MSDRFITALLIALGLGVVGWVGSRWIIYRHPAVTVKTEEQVTTNRTVRHHTVTTERVTTPTGEVRETTTRDLTVEEEARLSASVASSLSTPVFPPQKWLGLSVGRSVIGEARWQGGVLVTPMEFFSVGVETNERFDALYLRGTLWIK